VRILLLTQYFPPETGAPQNRLYDLVLKLQNKGATIQVLTAFPNYPQYKIYPGYEGHFSRREEMVGMDVWRSWIYVSQKRSILHRLLNYFSFTISSFIVGVFQIKKVDLIICESPPLFLGITAVFLKWIKGARLVFNVSDLWPESAVKLGIVTNSFLIKASTALELWIYRNADLISGQTQGIVRDIQVRFPKKKLIWLPNGVDPADLDSRITHRDWRKENGFQEADLLVYFGGLFGYAQGLDCILHAAVRMKDRPKVKFIMVGEGPEKERLMQMKADLDIDNIYFFPGAPKSEIIDIIRAMDIAIIPLKKVDLFLGAIPSKIFEILYLKKPVLLGIQGEAKELFIDQANAGIAFEPENDEALAGGIQYFLDHPEKISKYGENGHQFVIRHFDRQRISSDFWNFIQ